MTKQEYLAYHAAFCERMKATSIKKNADYTGSGSDPFKNFTLVERFGCVTAEQGFFTRMLDKMARLSSFIENGELQVKDESVQDSLEDLANYSILFSAYLESKKAKSST